MPRCDNCFAYFPRLVWWDKEFYCSECFAHLSKLPYMPPYYPGFASEKECIEQERRASLGTDAALSMTNAELIAKWRKAPGTDANLIIHEFCDRLEKAEAQVEEIEKGNQILMTEARILADDKNNAIEQIKVLKIENAGFKRAQKIMTKELNQSRGKR